MRIAVLSASNAWHFLDLKRAAGSSHEVFSFRFEDLTATVESDVSQKSEPSFNLDADCVIARTMPAGSLQQIVFRMDLLGQLETRGMLVLNSPRSIEAAVDKYLSLALLQSAGIAIPTTKVSQTLDAAIEQFAELGCDSVVKPLFGSMGNGIVRLQTVDAAQSHFAQTVEAGNVIYQQRFIDHKGFDIRLLVLGDQVVAMKRVNHHHWITNISQGGVGEVYTPTEIEIDIALRSARAVGAHFAGVDLMYDSMANTPLVLEVNAVPGWRAISKVLELDIAGMMIREVEKLRLTR